MLFQIGLSFTCNFNGLTDISNFFKTGCIYKKKCNLRIKMVMMNSFLPKLQFSFSTGNKLNHINAIYTCYFKHQPSLEYDINIEKDLTND